MDAVAPRRCAPPSRTCPRGPGPPIGAARSSSSRELPELAHQPGEDDAEHGEPAEQDDDHADPTGQHPLQQPDERVEQQRHDGARDDPPEHLVGGDEGVAEAVGGEHRHDDREGGADREADEAHPLRRLAHVHETVPSATAVGGDPRAVREAPAIIDPCRSRRHRRCGFAGVVSAERWRVDAHDARRRRRRRCCCALALLAVFTLSSTMLTRIGIGVLIALALDPLVDSLERRLPGRRGTAVAVVGVAVLGVAALLVLVLGPQAVEQVAPVLAPAPRHDRPARQAPARRWLGARPGPLDEGATVDRRPAGALHRPTPRRERRHARERRGERGDRGGGVDQRADRRREPASGGSAG